MNTTGMARTTLREMAPRTKNERKGPSDLPGKKGRARQNLWMDEVFGARSGMRQCMLSFTWDDHGLRFDFEMEYGIMRNASMILIARMDGRLRLQGIMVECARLML